MGLPWSSRAVAQTCSVVLIAVAVWGIVLVDWSAPAGLPDRGDSRPTDGPESVSTAPVGDPLRQDPEAVVGGGDPVQSGSTPSSEVDADSERDPSIRALERVYGEGPDRLVGSNLPPGDITENYLRDRSVNPNQLQLSGFHVRQIERLTEPFSRRIREMRGAYAEVQYEAMTRMLRDGRFVETTDAGVSQGLSANRSGSAFAMINGHPGEPYRAMELPFAEFPLLQTLWRDAREQDRFRRGIVADYISGLR